MAQEFYVDNLISRFIKCLLWDTYIPTVQIWKEDKNLIKGLTYITQDKHIVVAKKDYIVGKDIAPKNGLDSSYFTIIDTFVDGKFYRGITSNFESNSSLYDPDTHYMLGQYLRYLRDMYNLDLMPYYNCYSGISSDKIRIKGNNIIDDNQIDDGLISYIVPIKFNQDYTIYYKSEIPFYILPIYYNGRDAQLVSTAGGSTLQTVKVNRCTNNSPYKFDAISFDADNVEYYTANQLVRSDYLHLLIQVPKNTYSNLLVLEGNYKNINTYIDELNANKLPKLFIGDDKSLTDTQLNEIFKPYSSLRDNIGNINYAFSDRLVEYLLQAPIIKNDKIRYDIKRVQEYAQQDGLEEIYVPDIWSNKLRYFIYDYVSQHNKTHLYKDLNGYVDKDTEFMIDTGKISEEKWNV